MQFGTLVRLKTPAEAEAKFKELRENGFTSCQLVYKPKVYEIEDAKTIKAAAADFKIDISAMFCGFYDNATVWDLYYGFVTSGLNVEAYRAERTRYVEEAISFAKELGTEDVVIHAGFVPNNPFAPEYATLVASVRKLALTAGKIGLNLLLETGGEAPITMLRLIEDVGEDNLFINFDPANILMYGYGNPVDALMILGKYVRNFHGKDGELPTNPRKIGVEKKVGEGSVDFPKILAMLKQHGYDRYITIEREIEGQEQKRDILTAKNYLEAVWEQS